ncbi:sugar phosphate isomerase/epimerase family protein [Agromyces aerolatus]|uniref:sugar phosphate isomerase/epimerase family protein n=1 Tax=Agromyces sp. LY-1074 TaxID=3074080 RepID=UPI0028632592|nr:MULTISPECIES: sugar phosphate isomerase/epimerase [unclassified Agromyces]MDR5700851.1 sugar phosphate isomerase/epimerase [Agromyces sp. LY-1074]MDR5707488.1 sugar phosphate isomerase/epimerase [Agromyces sp. LY-1358]
MSVGIAVFEYAQPIGEALERAAALGVSQCELAVPNNLTSATREEAARAVRERGFTVTSVASLSKPNSVDSDEDTARMIALLDESLTAAEAVGAPFAIAYFGGHPTRPIDEGIERYAKLVERSVRRAEDLGVTILIENHFSHAPGEATNTAQGCVDLIHAVGSPAFALNFDLCNFAIGGQPFEDSYRTLKPYIRNVHVKDARPYDPVTDADYDGRIVHDLVHGAFMFVPVGQGITPNGELLDRIADDGLDLPITIEGHVPDDRIDDCFRAGLDFVKGRGL